MVTPLKARIWEGFEFSFGNYNVEFLKRSILRRNENHTGEGFYSHIRTDGDFGAIFVREQNCGAVPILKVDRIVIYRIGFCCFYHSSLHK